MRWFPILVVIGLLSRVSAYHFKTLTSTDLRKLTKNPTYPELWIIAFIDPTCSHSTKFLTVFDDIASVFAEASFARIDCTTETELCKERDVKFYPSIKFVRDGDYQDYGGSLDHDGLLSFLTQMTKPAITVIDHYQGIFHDIAQDAVVSEVAFVFYPSEKMPGKFEMIARTFQHMPLSFISLRTSESNDNWIKGILKSNLTHALIRMERGIENNIQLLRGKYEEKNMKGFITEGQRPTIPELTTWNKHELFSGQKFLAMTVIDKRLDSSHLFLNQLRNFVLSLTPSLKRHFDFVWVDAEQWGETLDKFDLSKSGEPTTFLVVEFPHELYWNFPKDIALTTLNVDQFLTEIVEGKILPKYTLNSDDNDADHIQHDNDDKLSSFFPFAREHQYLQRSKYFRTFLLIFVILDIILLGSTYLPASSRPRCFVDKYFWPTIDNFIERLIESPEDKDQRGKKDD